MKPLTLFLTLALLCALPASAATVVLCDADHPAVAGKVSAVIPSAHTPDYIGNPEAIVNPSLSSLAAVPTRYWRCTAAGSVVAMTAQQRTTLDAWEAEQQLAASRTANEASYDDEIILKALSLVILSETNRLREAICTLHPAACASLPQITPLQVRDAVRAKVRELTPGDTNSALAGNGGATR